MVSFQRMKEDFDDLSSQVSAKLPSRGVLYAAVAIGVLVVFVVGFGVGYGSKGGGGVCGGEGAPGCSEARVPVYYFVSNNSEACPPLTGERLLTTVEAGGSFEGLSVHLQCRGSYNPFPLTIKCVRKKIFDGGSVLQWSHLPVCYPSILVTPQHWSKVPHARSVSCTGGGGGGQATACRLHCIQNYVAVERGQYRCGMMPCREWTTDGKRCYICDQACDSFNELRSPSPSDLLRSLTCDADCDRIVVTSDGPAAVWQNKRTGLFVFLGEHNGRPVYQNNATREYLYFTFTGAEWLVGPDFKKPHAGKARDPDQQLGGELGAINKQVLGQASISPLVPRVQNRKSQFNCEFT